MRLSTLRWKDGMCWTSLSVIVRPLFAVSVSMAGAREALTITVCVAAPTSIWTINAFSCSGINCRSLRTFVLNPCLSTTRLKWSAGRALKLKTPSPLLDLTTFSLVARFVRVSVAPGTTAPVVSVTVPWMAVRNCA